MMSNSTKYMLDGLLTVEQFCENRRYLYYSDEYSEILGVDTRTKAFEAEFWPQLIKAYTKLRQYNYAFDIDQLGGKGQNVHLNEQAHEILANTESIIRSI